MKDDVFFADAEAQYFQQQLTNIKAGKQWTTIQGWDKQGKPILGTIQPPSDSAAEILQSNINLCLEVKKQKQKRIQELTNKTP